MVLYHPSYILYFLHIDALSSMSSGVKIESGSYTGDNREQKTITFSFAPKVIIMGSDGYSGLFVVCGSGGLCCSSKSPDSNTSPVLYTVSSTVSGNSVTIRAKQSLIHDPDTTYTYVGIG